MSHIIMTLWQSQALYYFNHCFILLSVFKYYSLNLTLTTYHTLEVSLDNFFNVMLALSQSIYNQNTCTFRFKQVMDGWIFYLETLNPKRAHCV